MKKNVFAILSLISLVMGFLGIIRLLSAETAEKLYAVNLPAGFPTRTGLTLIWGFLFVLWGLAGFFVYSVKLSPRSKRNIFLNSLILVIGIFIWNYMLFSGPNLQGALALAIADLLLGVVVWFMYLVSHRYGGYLFTPAMIWLCYLLYLSIALVIKN